MPCREEGGGGDGEYITQIYPDSGFKRSSPLLIRMTARKGALIEIYTGERKINSNVDNEVGENNLNPSSAQLEGLR